MSWLVCVDVEVEVVWVSSWLSVGSVVVLPVVGWAADVAVH